MGKNIILASASPARAKILKDAGLQVLHDPAAIDETQIKATWTGSAEGLALELARTKALRVCGRHPGDWVIGADQVLALGDEILDKPGEEEKVRPHLRKLRGREHQLVSAVCVAQDTKVLWQHAETAHMTMRDFSDAFLDVYVKIVGKHVADSVGAYHLEDLGAQLFDHVEGDFFTVLGLPLLPLLTFLRGAGALPS